MSLMPGHKICSHIPQIGSENLLMINSCRNFNFLPPQKAQVDSNLACCRSRGPVLSQICRCITIFQISGLELYMYPLPFPLLYFICSITLTLSLPAIHLLHASELQKNYIYCTFTSVIMYLNSHWRKELGKDHLQPKIQVERKGL